MTSTELVSFVSLVSLLWMEVVDGSQVCWSSATRSSFVCVSLRLRVSASLAGVCFSCGSLPAFRKFRIVSADFGDWRVRREIQYFESLVRGSYCTLAEVGHVLHPSSQSCRCNCCFLECSGFHCFLVVLVFSLSLVMMGLDKNYLALST